MQKIAGIVVLYNPGSEILLNIDSYINQIDKLFIVDNSDKVNDSLIERVSLLKNAEYLYNNSNIGIAGALNIAAKKAIKEGYDYLLTMDQDSKASTMMVDKLFFLVNTSPRIGIAAAQHLDPSFQQKSNKDFTKEILFTITSGNLLNLNAYRAAGEYLEKLFIDHVDHEYCLRLNKLGYKILQTNEVLVYHKIGASIQRTFLHHSFLPTHHSPVRIYYRTRNRLYVNSLYKNIFPKYVKEDRRHFLRELFEIIMFEKQKINKLKMILHGYFDFKRKKFGKYSYDK